MLAMQNVRNLSEKLKSTVSGHNRNGSIAIVRQAVRNQSSIDVGSLVSAVDDVVANRLWSKVRTPTGSTFDSFASFALARASHGLGVADQSAARLVRYALLEKKHFREWTELLKEIARKPGNPGNIANGECSRFYTVGRSPTCRDRLLLTLEGKDLHAFARVCAGECSPRSAAIDAGLLPPRSIERVGFQTIVDSAMRMNKKAQGKLLNFLFDKMSLDAQCALIANSIEVGLGVPELAKQWRDRSE